MEQCAVNALLMVYPCPRAAPHAGMAKLAPGAKDFVSETIPLRHAFGTKADIALACVYLASTAAAFVSGG